MGEQVQSTEEGEAEEEHCWPVIRWEDSNEIYAEGNTEEEGDEDGERIIIQE